MGWDGEWYGGCVGRGMKRGGWEGGARGRRGARAAADLDHERPLHVTCATGVARGDYRGAAVVWDDGLWTARDAEGGWC